MKKALVTGGAGFIGRWLVKKLLHENIEVWVIDNLDNGQESHLDEFAKNPLLKEVVIDDILNQTVLGSMFKENFDVVYHLAAQINVQESLQNPEKAFEVNVKGTYNLLEECRIGGTKLVLMGTCMVYDLTSGDKAIDETHPIKPLSPYAGSKIAAETLAESYHRGFGLPLVICRPFNTYGPFQKSNLEGGVISIFIKKFLSGEKLEVFGDGTQTRDFLYVEDCADFVYRASRCEKAQGEVINAGLGEDIAIKDLAKMICEDDNKIRFVKHHHPQSEIQKLLCDNYKARSLLNWQPETGLREGIEKLKQWQKTQFVSA